MGQKFLVTGGAGFIGSNYVSHLLKRGEKVSVLDNLARPGSEKNLKWLLETYGKDSFDFVEGDIRNQEVVAKACKDANVIAHFAAQVAVTTSVLDPRNDFDINALGTFNVLEGARLSGKQPVVIFSSTNKVYGDMITTEIVETPTHYAYKDCPKGIGENLQLDFYSPYGCSKGTADQYVRDYARIYKLPTCVLRLSCIYGTRQFGIEDQGWIAWFIIAATLGKQITIYGDGKQVRDVLFVEDLVRAFDIAVEKAPSNPGAIYNLGGGPSNAISIYYQLFSTLEELLGRKLDVAWSDWRPGDQKVFITDISKAKRELAWEPKVDVKTGVDKLCKWVTANKHLFS